MEVLGFSINAMAPVLIAAGLGWFLVQRGTLDEELVIRMNRVCFSVFLPIMLFHNTYSMDIRTDFNLSLMLYAVCAVLACVVALGFLYSRFIPDRRKRAATLNATFRSNYLVFALPIITGMFGQEGTAVASMLMPITVILYNFVGVSVMCYYSGEKDQPFGALIRHTVLDICRNPLIIGSVLGILFALLPVQAPRFMESAVTMLGSIGSPLTLVLLGAQIDWKTLQGNIRLVIGASLIRVVAVPAVGILPAIAMGFRGPELGALFMMLATPCPATSSVLARHYNMAPKYAAQLVVLSTVLSCFTIFGGISLLRGLGLF